MKKSTSLREGLISAIEGEDKLKASLPPGTYAIQGPGGYIVMPGELTGKEWEARQCTPQKD